MIMDSDIFEEVYDPNEEIDDEYLKMISDFIERKSEECYGDTAAAVRDEQGFCSRTFDSLTCWKETPAGRTAYARCPAIIPGFDPRRKAFRECTENGTWANHHISGVPWSNYTTCLDLDAVQDAEFLNRIYVAGYTCSAIALLLGLVIFCSYRSLQCTRVTIHKNLFLSFLIADVMWIVLYKEVIEKPKVMILNMVWCQMWYVFTQYLYIANHHWMFCEGFYLHSLLSLTFINERRLLVWFYVIGWLLPIPVLVVYVLLRYFYEKSAYECWVHENNQSLSYYVLSAPLVISLVANLCFLFNIIRLLLTKLRRMPGGHQDCEHKRGSLVSDQGNRGSKETMMQVPVRDFGRGGGKFPTNQSPSFPEDKSAIDSTSVTKDLRKDSEATEVFVASSDGKSKPVLRRGRISSDKTTLFPRGQTCPCIYRKAVRATMFLVPLLGLHFLLSPFSEQEPEPPVFATDDITEAFSKQLEDLTTKRPFYDTLLAITASFQGFCVSLLYCILNGEVLALFRRKFERRKMRSEQARPPTIKVLRPPTNLCQGPKGAIAVIETEKL